MVFGKVPTTVAMAMEWYGQSLPDAKRTRELSNLKSALKRCLLTGYGFDRDELSTKAGLHCCLSRLSLREFRKAKVVFQEVATARQNAGEICASTVFNYKSNLYRFVEWLQQQEWYEEALASCHPEMTPRIYSGHSFHQSQKVKPLNIVPYSLKSEDYPEHLKQQLVALQEFWTVSFHPRRLQPPLRPASIKTYLMRIKMFLGWVKNVYRPGMELNELNLELFTQVELVEEFVNWGLGLRENSYTWAFQVVKAAIFVTKWWEANHPPTIDEPTPERLLAALELLGLKPTAKFFEQYSPSRSVTSRLDALQAYQRSLQRIEKKQPNSRRTLHAEKLLTFSECLQVLEYLEKCCANRRIGGILRSEAEVFKSVQRYTLIKLLVFCPIRQREIRELELGRTLKREEFGYVIKLSPSDHKTGSATGLSREFLLPEVLTATLDEWLNVWRGRVITNHQLVFISLGSKRHSELIGQPLSENALCSLVKTTMRRATNVLFGTPLSITPHDFRRIAITHQRKFGSPEQNEALAALMGHSLREADEIYNYMTPIEKTKKALNWWQPSPN